jgi:hypothetical protein
MTCYAAIYLAGDVPPEAKEYAAPRCIFSIRLLELIMKLPNW